ncbi:UDP-N-acetylmuramate--L-alanine ligase [Candidatus Peregrinibacteria bacterium]|nr:UDP-N-acetylmuramate--L-alanine ligase [Candidatus Peregrinibacteria bacterium]
MKIFCSGIGGIGLSAYAALQRAAGHQVLGSDRTDSALLHDLRSQGISITLNQDGSALSKDIDLFVYSEAIPATSPERRKAAELGIPQQSYPQAVAELTKGKHLIAVCGTHGKSSTTAMAGRLLLESGLDPTIVVGTKMKELGGKNWRKGSGDIFLLEACEYRRSFLNYSPSVVLLTTCDGDHFDYFTSKKDYHDAYVEFLRRLPSDGVVITHMDDPECAAVATASGKKILDAGGCPEIMMKTPGEHMRRNAKLALALGEHLGLPGDESRKILSSYAGSWRRMDIRGEMKEGITVIDDYGHHPLEIRATLAGLREAYPKRRIVCVFQPHTHDRTKKLYREFTQSFRDADLVVIANVYDARAHLEKGSVDVDEFVTAISKRSRVETKNGHSLQETEKMLRALTKNDDVVVCMGAGDITDLATRLLS